MDEKYVRGIDNRFVLAFINLDGELNSLYKMLEDKRFQLEIRKNYINIYYKGGNLFKVRQLKYSYVIDFDTKYLMREHKNQKIILELKSNSEKSSNIIIKDIQRAIENRNAFCEEMDHWFSIHPKEERKLQQEVCLKNRPNEDMYLLDIEYAYTGFGRADMLFVKKENKQFKVYIVELKQGIHSISSRDSNNKQKAGLYKHYCDAVNLSCQGKKELFESVKNNILIRKSLGEKFFAEVETPILAESIEFVIALYGYVHNDKKDKNGQSLDKLENEIKRIEEEKAKVNLHYHIKKFDKDQDIIIKL